ncbi:MAG: hypothetical protein ACU83U_12940 [Gammaproteobacteria bacterium]
MAHAEHAAKTLETYRNNDRNCATAPVAELSKQANPSNQLMYFRQG